QAGEVVPNCACLTVADAREGKRDEDDDRLAAFQVRQRDGVVVLVFETEVRGRLTDFRGHNALLLKQKLTRCGSRTELNKDASAREHAAAKRSWCRLGTPTRAPMPRVLPQPPTP